MFSSRCMQCLHAVPRIGLKLGTRNLTGNPLGDVAGLRHILRSRPSASAEGGFFEVSCLGCQGDSLTRRSCWNTDSLIHRYIVPARAFFIEPAFQAGIWFRPVCTQGNNLGLRLGEATLKQGPSAFWIGSCTSASSNSLFNV